MAEWVGKRGRKHEIYAFVTGLLLLAQVGRWVGWATCPPWFLTGITIDDIVDNKKESLLSVNDRQLCSADLFSLF